MKQTTKDNIISWTLGIFTILVILASIVMILNKMPTQQEYDRQMQLTADHCCYGQYCTDTYYSEDDDKCHSTFFDLSDWKRQLGVFSVVVVIAFLVLVVFMFRNSGEKKQ